MRHLIIITWTSLQMAFEELRTNKLRSFLSLLGVTFGIFSIISVLSTISSMKKAISQELNSIGNNAIFVQKYENSTDSNYPWWKFIKRPETNYKEMKILQSKMPQIKDMAFMMSITSVVDKKGLIMTGVHYYGVSEKFDKIQVITITTGRYFQPVEFSNGLNVIVIGYTIAEQLFDKAENAINKRVKLKGNKTALIIGVLSKQGKSIIDAWDYDHSVLLPYFFMRNFVREEYSSPIIMVKGVDQMTTAALRDELKGTMRSIRKLKVGQEDNFALNDISFFAKLLDPIFVGLNFGGWAIAALSLFVGMFGVANIMFVTVRERTSQIGLKKAIGAQKVNILIEFLVESIVLCILGGIIGLVLVFILTQVLSLFLSFRVLIPGDIVALALSICIIIGVLAGITPAMKAANLNPVMAIKCV